MILNELFVGNILHKSDLICFYTVKLFHLLLFNTKNSGKKLSNPKILFDITYSFLRKRFQVLLCNTNN